jgi:hypothetical protein
METLINLLLVLLIGFMAACLGMCFQRFMEKNMIFFPWAVFIAWLSMKGEVWRHLTRPLGRCRYCNSTYIALYGFYLLVYPYMDLPDKMKILCMFLSVGITFFFIKIFTDYLFPDIDPNGDAEKYLELVSKIEKMKPTPVRPMLWSYLVIASVYGFFYIVIPFMTIQLPQLLASK